MGERVVRNDEVRGSIPLGSTIFRVLETVRGTVSPKNPERQRRGGITAEDLRFRQPSPGDGFPEKSRASLQQRGAFILRSCESRGLVTHALPCDAPRLLHMPEHG